MDLFDFGNSLVASDVFEGIDTGQAFSELITTLNPGSYLLRFTGIATEGARYRIDLATDGSLPDFSLIPADPVLPSSVSVPEPGMLALLGVGLAGLSLSRRKR